MAELIDRDALWSDWQKEGHATMRSLAAYINAAKAVDAVPVVHGRWIPSEKHKPWLTCSACEDCYVDGEWIDGHKWSYCPNCGAKMGA